MHILVTGGTGLIGTRLIQQLILQSHQITVLSRSPQKVYSQFCRAVNHLGSLQNITDLNQFDAVINLAGEPIADKRWTAAQKQRLCTSRWEITQRLATLINTSSQPPQVFISGSAVGYYGSGHDQKILTEQSPAHDEFTHQLCKRWEELAQQAESPKTRVCLLRTGIVLAKNGGALGKMLPPFKWGVGGPIGRGTQYMPWIHLNDMVNAIIFLLDHSTLSGPFNLTSPNPVHNAQFASALGKVLHRPAFMRVPALVIQAIMGESSVLVLEGQRALPAHLQQAGFNFEFSYISDALNDIFNSTAK
ncbi:TIGR01777 family oxidoreductase [Moellerella wisconsensis]|uniref:TIGR01777 family oxidoreductase n=1 Tax=Moellerella wisconsensis TaxID=158849 RepID=A0A9Q8V2U1_9GAMM|nr:TIGR01777 family oxidoreductase [Moellerella wisconsensis]UNH29689.1 TIGR01777 family oxidoreductase [Moellerella wisconsensis]